jgi:hypothetical protein
VTATLHCAVANARSLDGNVRLMLPAAQTTTASTRGFLTVPAGALEMTLVGHLRRFRNVRLTVFNPWCFGRFASDISPFRYLERRMYPAYRRTKLIIIRVRKSLFRNSGSKRLNRPSINLAIVIIVCSMVSFVNY